MEFHPVRGRGEHTESLRQKEVLDASALKLSLFIIAPGWSGLTHLNFESHKQEISVKGCLESFGLHTQFAWNPLDKIDTHGS